jgi:hypothetical protein
MWSRVISIERPCRTINLRRNLLSAEKFIAGIKKNAVGIVVIAIMIINTKASKF